MNEGQENGLVEHHVVVDNYISATLKIPKILTALELKGLMIKAKKLYELSGDALDMPKRHYEKKNGKKEETTMPSITEKQNLNQRQAKWKKPQIKMLKDAINSRKEGETVMSVIRNISEKIGMTENQCFHKYKNLMVRDAKWKLK
jgi:predicted RNA-binding protein with RPS1 domain